MLHASFVQNICVQCVITTADQTIECHSQLLIGYFISCHCQQRTGNSLWSVQITLKTSWIWDSYWWFHFLSWICHNVLEKDQIQGTAFTTSPATRVIGIQGIRIAQYTLLNFSNQERTQVDLNEKILNQLEETKNSRIITSVSTTLVKHYISYQK